MSADKIGIGLKGRRNGTGWLVRCPCPNHGKGRGDRSPSLSIADGDDGRLLLRCFAGCEFLDILDALKRLGLIGDCPKLDRARLVLKRVEPAQPIHDPDLEALNLWVSCKPAPDSLVEQYLNRQRGIDLKPPPSLRCGSTLHLGRIDMPLMVAAVQRPADGKIVAAQSLMLTHAGKKASVSNPRKNTGALGLGAVRLAGAAEVMGLAEGIESGLSAMQLAGIPVWISLGATRLHRVELPPLCKELHIFCDNDVAGRDAAKRTAAVHMQAGRKVLLRYPPERCGDWNNFLLEQAAEHAA